MRQNTFDRKIFGLGLPRTGNVTLASCIWTLCKQETMGWNKKAADHLLNGNTDDFKKMTEEFSSMTEMPWCCVYENLYEWYPDAIFILTHRENNSWITSMKIQINPKTNPETQGGAALRKWFFGSEFPNGNEDAYLAKYEQHNKNVKSFFEHKNNFISVDWQNSEWSQICKILDAEIPNSPFPYLNKGTIHGKRKEILHL